MRKNRKNVIYYKEGEVIGIREHAFDWKPGDTIITDGESTIIYAVYEDNRYNHNLVKKMFKLMNSTRSQLVCTCPKEFLEGMNEEAKQLMLSIFTKRIRFQRFNFDQKFEILDKFLDYFTNVEFED